MKYVNYWYVTEYLKSRIKSISHCNQGRESREEVILRMIRDWDLPSSEAEKIRLFLADPDCMN
ncbi:MAG: hypothetical protein P9L98_01785 [Candidatus Kaelpia imicola]|nr:hypothetical protein [Candidatus Kaelpia imicola]